MKTKSTPKLIQLGRANRQTRAGDFSGLPEVIPTERYKM